GYLNQPKFTDEQFLINPFQNQNEKQQNKNSILYRTGDLVRYLPDENFEYIGRHDSQVKVRGYRIELGEIESILNSYNGVKQSIVITQQYPDRNTQSENKYIIAYYVAMFKLDEEEILRYISTKLPDYMVPNVLIWLEKIPLTANGKVDKAALPKHPLILHNNYVAPRNIIEFKICIIYSEILNLPSDNIGIKHDFFKLGGNSLLAIKLLYKLQQEFTINLNDIFKLRIPASIAKLTPALNGNLYHKLKQMKLIYDKLSSYKISIEMHRKKGAYLQEAKQINLTCKLKNIQKILLTGATGYLGCHILYQLLHETKYKIYLLIRAKSNIEACNKINRKFKYYFDTNLNNYQNRVIAISADIEEPGLELSKKQYRELITSVDSIIHSAALVKHYGDYATFYQANVQATINLLELAKQTKHKDFHYISTLSILTNGYITKHHYHIWTEDDEHINFESDISNVYNKTKYEGELAVIRYRKFGINSNIYRVGNLAMNSKNYRSQENIEENAFFTRVKTILDVGMIPEEIAKVEISPVDYTALAITKLFNQKELSNKIFHLANPHICNLSDLLVENNNVHVKTVAFEEFIEAVLIRLNNKIKHEQIERFMLHQTWLEETDQENLTKMVVLQAKTDQILSKLNFSWPEITTKMISNVINKTFLR